MTAVTGLTSYKPGQSGNPGGRPKGFGALIRAETQDGAELVAMVLKMLRSKSNLKTRQWAIDWLSDRGWGRPVQATEISGPEGTPITFVPWAPALSDNADSN